MITNAIARRYAKALIELAQERQTVEKFHGDLKDFESVLSANPECTSFFLSPASAAAAKMELLKEIAGKLNLSDMVADFLFLLLEKNRLDQLSHITAAYRAYADELAGLLRGTVTSALPLEDEKVEALRAALEKSTGKKVLLQVDVDPSLIGGVITRIGDEIFDGSVRTQLDRIQDTLQKG